VRVFEGNLGTFINDRPVDGEQEVHDLDSVKVGALTFTVRLEVGPVLQRTEPAPASSAESEEDAAANLLLAIEEEERFARDPSADTLRTLGDSHEGEPNKAYPPRTSPIPSDEPDTAAVARNLLARFRKRREPEIGTLKVPVAH
jgi:hypothetical protein